MVEKSGKDIVEKFREAGSEAVDMSLLSDEELKKVEDYIEEANK